MMQKQVNQKRIMLMVPLLDQGGQERICALTAQLLKEQCQVCLLVFSTKDMIYDVSGVDLIDLNRGSKKGLFGKLLNVLVRVKEVKKIKKDRKIDIAYSFGPSANLVNALSKGNEKVWLGVRGYDALPEHQYEKRLYKRADKVICCSKVMADDVGKMIHSNHVDYLYNPCEVEKFRELGLEKINPAHLRFLEEKGPNIISVGRATDRKGFWHQIKSFALIKKSIPDAKLIFVGDGDFEAYKKLADDLNIRQSILFAGVQKNPFSYLAKASLYLLTSSAEGFPNALVEAMAMGVPIMSTNCKTGPSEILADDYESVSDNQKVHIGEYGIIIPVFNPVKNLDASVIEPEEYIMAQEAIKILSDEEKLDEMRNAARKRSECFTQDKYLESLLLKLG